MSDWQLLQRYLDEGAEDAFAELVRRYTDLVHATALRRVRCDATARDVTQATFIVLARKAHSIRQRGSLGAWLFQTARFAAIDALRRQGTRRRHEQQAAAMRPEHHESPEADWADIGPHLEPALDRLPAKDRDAIVMRFFEDRTFEQIGEALGVNASTAHGRVHRAIGKLQRALRARGVEMSAVGLGAVMASNAVHAAPVGLAASTTTAALATGSLGSAVASATALGIAQGALTTMGLAKAKLAVAIALVALAIVGGGAVAVQQVVAAAARSPAVVAPSPALLSDTWVRQHVAVAAQTVTTSAEIRAGGGTAGRRVQLVLDFDVDDEPHILGIGDAVTTRVDAAENSGLAPPQRFDGHRDYEQLEPVRNEGRAQRPWRTANKVTTRLTATGPMPEVIDRWDLDLHVLVAEQLQVTEVPFEPMAAPVPLEPAGTVRIDQIAARGRIDPHWAVRIETAGLNTNRWTGRVEPEADAASFHLPDALLSAVYAVYADGRVERHPMVPWWNSDESWDSIGGEQRPVALRFVVATQLRELRLPLTFEDVQLPRSGADPPAGASAAQMVQRRLEHQLVASEMAGMDDGTAQRLREELVTLLDGWRPVPPDGPSREAIGRYVPADDPKVRSVTILADPQGRLLASGPGLGGTYPLFARGDRLLLVTGEIIQPVSSRLQGDMRYELARYELRHKEGRLTLSDPVDATGAVMVLEPASGEGDAP